MSIETGGGYQRRKPSKRERRNGGKNTEKWFASVLVSTFLKVNPNPPSIRCEEPVENSKGDKVKKVTHPDFLVINPKTGEEMFIEVTKSSRGGGHKTAQQNVVDAAGVENYIVITGDHIKTLEDASTAENRLNLIYEWFGWEC